MYKALSYSLNIGVIKLIYKRGEKHNLSNWRPITMLPLAYNIFAKALAKRLDKHLDTTVDKFHHAMTWQYSNQNMHLQMEKCLQEIRHMHGLAEMIQEMDQCFVHLKRMDGGNHI